VTRSNTLITAQGRKSGSDTGYFVFDKASVILTIIITTFMKMLRHVYITDNDTARLSLAPVLQAALKEQPI